MMSTTLAEGAPAGKETHFARVLAYVYEHDPRLAAERASLKALDQRVDMAYSGFRPNAYGEIDYGRRRERINNSDYSYGDTRTRSLVVEQPLFSGFGTLAEFRAAKERVAAGRNQLLLKEEQILLEAASAYLDVAEKWQMVDLNYANSTNIHKQHEGAQKRFKAGDSTRTEVAQAESRLADAESALSASYAELEKARATYERTTGLKAEPLDFPELPPQLPQSLEEAKDKAQNAPEIAVKASEEKAGAQDVKAASSSLWPALSLRGSIGDERDTPVSGTSLLRNDQITLNLRIPLYQGGAEYARVREAKDNAERLRFEKRDAQRAAIERASQLWADHAAAKHIIESARRAANAAEEALHGVTSEQHAGLRTLLDVLDAQNEWLSRQVNEVQAQKNLRLSAYRLLAATGKLTAEGLQLDTPQYDPAAHYDDNATSWAGF